MGILTIKYPGGAGLLLVAVLAACGAQQHTHPAAPGVGTMQHEPDEGLKDPFEPRTKMADAQPAEDEPTE